MAGVTGFRDLREPNNQERQGLLQNQAPQGDYPILGYGMSIGTPEECRKESFWEMLKFIFCPFFVILSFILFITVVDIAIYFLTVFYDYDSEAFLEPTEDSLDTFGAKNPEKQHDYQVWRWVTPVVLHADLNHIFFNVLIQLILGFRLEPTVGTWRTAVVYILSGMGGVLFSSLVSTSLAVGASTAIFGIISAMIAWIIMNWSALEGNFYRTFTLVWLIILLFLNVLLGFVRFI